eukprot:390075-Amorphochlora_amoeboformis.AAC.1
MMRLVKARNQALKGRKSEAQTQASGPICDGDMIYGGPKLAEGLASRFLQEPLPPCPSLLSNVTSLRLPTALPLSLPLHSL